MNSKYSTLFVRDPEDGRLLAELPISSEREIENVLAQADHARRVARAMPAHQRASILLRASELATERMETLAQCIASEGIKTIVEARLEATRCAMTLRLAGEEARRLGTDVLQLDGETGGVGRIGWVQRAPLGVIAAITPYNDPLNLVAHKIAPAIAAGNAVILKPHPATPLSALELVQIMEEAGLPPKVLQVLIGDWQVGAALVADARVQMISLTGGRSAGQAVAAAAGVKRLAMELGGNCPTIVMPDADLDDAVQRCASGAIWAAGQNCLHVQRILVHQQVYARFQEAFVAAVEKFQPGSKQDPRSNYGCMINDAHADAVMRTIERASSLGRRLTGGTREGRQIRAAVFDQVSPTDAVVTEEVFGPVTFLMPFEHLHEAVTIANAQPYGLQAGIFTQQIDVALQAADTLDVGAVLINDATDWRVDGMPFGGVKGTGIGREGIRDSVLAMTEPKLTAIRRMSNNSISAKSENVASVRAG